MGGMLRRCRRGWVAARPRPGMYLWPASKRASAHHLVHGAGVLQHDRHDRLSPLDQRRRGGALVIADGLAIQRPEAGQRQDHRRPAPQKHADVRCGGRRPGEPPGRAWARARAPQRRNVHSRAPPMGDAPLPKPAVPQGTTWRPEQPDCLTGWHCPLPEAHTSHMCTWSCERGCATNDEAKQGLPHAAARTDPPAPVAGRVRERVAGQRQRVEVRARRHQARHLPHVSQQVVRQRQHAHPAELLQARCAGQRILAQVQYLCIRARASGRGRGRYTLHHTVAMATITGDPAKCGS